MEIEDNLDLAPRKSEVTSQKPEAKKAAVKKKTASKKAAVPRKVTVPLPDNNTNLRNEPSEPYVDPLKILSMGKGIPKADEEKDEYSQMNVIEDGKTSKQEIVDSEIANLMKNKGNIINDDVVIPHVRKVAIKKINHFNFRLGMERTAEKFNLIPGTSHTWMCDKKGNEFMTGLDDQPELRARLEKKLRVDLGNTSTYWASLSFQIEDKEHGQILNFDDKQMGAYYEVVYNAMLASSMIANGYQEYTSGEKPLAEWYIENKEAEAEQKQLKMSVEMEANEMFQNISLSKKAGIAKMLNLRVWGVSEKVASVELWEFIKGSYSNAEAFLKIVRLRDDELAVAVLIKEAIKYNVIRKNGINDLTFANETLGPTEDHVIRKLVNPSNADTRISIQRQVDLKRNN